MNVRKRPNGACTAVVVVLLAVGPAPAPAATAAATSGAGVAAWLDGNASQAARELASRTDREGVLNRAVALLYAGEAAAAERELADLRAREPRFTPALRWLARARAAIGSPAADETLQALLAAREATSRDFLWVGAVRLAEGGHERARASLAEAVRREEDLYLGWLWLGDAEQALGRAGAARAAWLRARALHAGEDVLHRLGEPVVAPPPDFAMPDRTGETLRFTAKYLFFKFATVTVENRGVAEINGRRGARVVFSIRSNPGFPLLDIDSRFESVIAEDGSVVAHRSSSRDSTQGFRAAAYDMDAAAGECVVRQVVDGVFGFDRLPLPAFDQDGISVLQLARVLARAPGRLSVATAVDSTWKGTELRTVGGERIRWRGRDVDTTLVEAVGHYNGPAGLSGLVRTWISRDARALPYRSAIKVALGSVVLELRDDADPASD